MQRIEHLPIELCDMDEAFVSESFHTNSIN